jgi:hypothetical protein
MDITGFINIPHIHKFEYQIHLFPKSVWCMNLDEGHIEGLSSQYLPSVFVKTSLGNKANKGRQSQ